MTDLGISSSQGHEALHHYLFAVLNGMSNGLQVVFYRLRDIQ